MVPAPERTLAAATTSVLMPTTLAYGGNHVQIQHGKIQLAFSYALQGLLKDW
jgi:hypothetical protein